MPDIFTKAKRSQVMSSIRGRGNRDTELALIRIFRSQHITGWRRNQPVFGKPDFVFPKLRLAVFVDGCFWHCCPQHATKPKNNATFWRKKLAANKARDQLVTRELRSLGWRVIRIWEHELAGHAEKCVARLRKAVGPEVPQAGKKESIDLTGQRVIIRCGSCAGQEGICLGRTEEGSRWAISPDASTEILQLASERGFRLLVDHSAGGKERLSG
jgi:DNA mismatch endonuclease (patch repair protein)